MIPAGYPGYYMGNLCTIGGNKLRRGVPNSNSVSDICSRVEAVTIGERKLALQTQVRTVALPPMEDHGNDAPQPSIAKPTELDR